jgi:DNA-binding LacI/PurR family transcriptional regulator
MDRAGLPRRVTLADVAARARVSRATASRALAGDARISGPTRAQVVAAAEALRYVPNAAARSLRVRSTRTLGLLLADLGDPVHGQVAAGFEHEASRHGYTVVIVAGSNVPDHERAAIGVFVRHATDGIALVSSVLDPAEARELAGPGRPLVIVQPDHPSVLRRRADPPDGLIQTDDAGGVEAATWHLVNAGHRRIGYLGAGGRPSDTVRAEAVSRVVAEAGLAVLPTVTLADDAWRDPTGVAAALPEPPPDAVVCYDDKLALALLDGLRSQGVRVPDEVSVVGFDGIPFASLSNPRLTTVSTPTHEMGRLAARILVDAIAQGRLPAGRILPTELVVRESVRRADRPAPSQPAPGAARP